MANNKKTIYNAAGIGEDALQGLRKAGVRIAAAYHRIRMAQVPDPMKPLDPPELPKIPTHGGNGIRLDAMSHGYELIAGNTSGSVGDLILARLSPASLLALTEETERTAAEYERIADEWEVTVHRAVEAAVRDVDPAIRALAQRITKGREDEIKAKIDRESWIAQHGSDRLKRCVAEGIECTAAYRDERLAIERPGWAWMNAEARVKSWDAPRNPPVWVFPALDEARKGVPDAELGYYVGPIPDPDYEEDGTPMERKRDGYLVAAEFLGETICRILEESEA